MGRTVEYKGHDIREVDGHWETLIGGLWHKRKTYDAMRDHLDRLNKLADEPWPPIIIPLTGRPVPEHAQHAVADLLSAIMRDHPANYEGERRISVVLDLKDKIVNVTGIVVT